MKLHLQLVRKVKLSAVEVEETPKNYRIERKNKG